MLLKVPESARPDFSKVLQVEVAGYHLSLPWATQTNLQDANESKGREGHDENRRGAALIAAADYADAIFLQRAGYPDMKFLHCRYVFTQK